MIHIYPSNVIAVQPIRRSENNTSAVCDEPWEHCWHEGTAVGIFWCCKCHKYHTDFGIDAPYSVWWK